MGKYTFGEFARFVIRKCWVTVLCVVFFTAVLAMPVAAKSDSGTETYTDFCGQIAEFKNHAVYVAADAGGVTKYVDYNDVWYRPANLHPFFDQISEKYDMDVFCPGWSGKSAADKIEWMKTAFTSTVVANTPKYEFTVTVNVDGDSQDYVQRNLVSLFNDFLSYAESTAKLYRADTSMAPIGEVQTQFEGGAAVSSALLKYGIIGVFLGIVFGLLAEGIWFLCGKKAWSKQYFKSAFYTDCIENSKDPAYEIACRAVSKSKDAGNPVVALSTTAGNNSVFGAVVEKLIGFGYKTGVANLSGCAFALPEKAAVLPEKTLESLRTPGHSGELAAAAADYDFLVLITDSPAKDPAAAELLSRCAYVVFAEKIGKSVKRELEVALAALPVGDKPAACVAWL